MKHVPLLVIALFVTGNAFAQPAQPAIALPPPYQYAAKIICGKPIPGVAAMGTYYTIVNVHNPDPIVLPDRYVGGRKKFVTTLPDEGTSGGGNYMSFRLFSDGGMRIDCPNIWKHLNMQPGTFIDGFAVIESTGELDVIAVYTAEGLQGVSSIHTERVPVRKILF